MNLGKAVFILGMLTTGAVGLLHSSIDAIEPDLAPPSTAREATILPPPGQPPGTIIKNPCPGCPAPGFVSGIVIGREGETLLVELYSSAPPVRIRPAREVRISWDLRWDEIRVGDSISGTGDVALGGAVTVRIIDVNVTQLRGTIAAVDEDGSWLVLPGRRPSGALDADPSIPTDDLGRIRVRFDIDNLPVDLGEKPVSPNTLREAKTGAVVWLIGSRAPYEDVVTGRRLVSYQ
jgi:hypothetical protein